MSLNWLHHNYSKEDLVNSPSFRKWVRGKASSTQKAYWDQWIKDDPRNRRLAAKAQEEVTGFSIQPSGKPDVQQAWNSLERSVREGAQAREVEFSSPRKNRGIGVLWKIAASILLTVITGLSVYYYYPEKDPVAAQEFIKQEVKTDYKERKQIELSDGSRITLNAHSRLIYKTNKNNPENTRVILLGEAFFSVAKRTGADPSPFKVRTADGEIQVLGTEFAVSTRNNKTRVVLQEGSVAVEPLMRSGGQVLLKPGEMAEFFRTREAVDKKEVNTLVYTSWRSGRLVFDKTGLPEVIDRLEFTFGVDVIVRDTNLFAQKITGSVENTNLEVIASALSKTLDAPVKITENTVYFGK